MDDDKKEIMESEMDEKITETKEVKTTELKCPKGFPIDVWERWNIAQRLNYLDIINRGK